MNTKLFIIALFIFIYSFTVSFAQTPSSSEHGRHIKQKDTVSQQYIYDKMRIIFDRDVEARNLMDLLESSYQQETCGKLILHVMDSINAKEFLLLIDTIGFLPDLRKMNYDAVSIRYMTFFFHNLYKLGRDKMLPLLQDAYHKGFLGRDFIPCVLDRYQMNQNGKTYFGKLNGIPNAYREIEDVEHVDERRAEYGYEPLWKEAKRNGIEKLPSGYKYKEE